MQKHMYVAIVQCPVSTRGHTETEKCQFFGSHDKNKTQATIFANSMLTNGDHLDVGMVLSSLYNPIDTDLSASAVEEETTTVNRNRTT